MVVGRQKELNEMFTEPTLTDQFNNEIESLTVCSDRLIAVLALVYGVHPAGMFSSSDIAMNPMAMYDPEDREVLTRAYEAYAKNEFPETNVTNEDLLNYQICYLEELRDGFAE